MLSKWIGAAAERQSYSKVIDSMLERSLKVLREHLILDVTNYRFLMPGSSEYFQYIVAEACECYEQRRRIMLSNVIRVRDGELVDEAVKAKAEELIAESAKFRLSDLPVQNQTDCDMMTQSSISTGTVLLRFREVGERPLSHIYTEGDRDGGK